MIDEVGKFHTVRVGDVLVSLDDLHLETDIEQLEKLALRDIVLNKRAKSTYE